MQYPVVCSVHCALPNNRYSNYELDYYPTLAWLARLAVTFTIYDSLETHDIRYRYQYYYPELVQALASATKTKLCCCGLAARTASPLAHLIHFYQCGAYMR
jgi:hypothetical protein